MIRMLQASEENGSTPKSAKKTDRKLWALGDTIEINVDKYRPAVFESKEAEVEWDRETAKNALKFKQQVESGQYIPDEIRIKLENKTNRSPEEEEILRQGLAIANRKERVRHKIIRHYPFRCMNKCVFQLFYKCLAAFSIRSRYR